LMKERTILIESCVDEKASRKIRIPPLVRIHDTSMSVDRK
jgi:hypothetical protein